MSNSEFFERIGLVRKFDLSYELTLEEFTTIFRENTDSYRYNPLEVFSSSKNRYKGKISNDVFSLKLKRKLFDSRINFVRAKGEIKLENSSLEIQIEVIGWNMFMNFFTLVLIVFYTTGFTAILQADDFFGIESRLIISFVLFLHFILFVSYPFFLLRKSVKELSHQLKYDFSYYVKTALKNPKQYFESKI